MRFFNKSQGFSLLELLTSVIIISLLILLSYLVIPKLVNKALDSRRKTDLDKIKNVLEIFITMKIVIQMNYPNAVNLLFPVIKCYYPHFRVIQ